MARNVLQTRKFTDSYLPEVVQREAFKHSGSFVRSENEYTTTDKNHSEMIASVLIRYRAYLETMHT